MMSSSVDITRVDSAAAVNGAPRLSILIPYFRDDPTELLESLCLETAHLPSVEILIYDDGTGDEALNQRVSAAVKASSSCVRLLIAHENRGRAFARNTLKAEARADWVLFLDADMRPVSNRFVSLYLDKVEANTADIIFGGFEVPHQTSDPERELHRAFSQTSDCLTLEMRQKHGPQYVCSSNLCVRKTALDAEPFDPEFTGWGWEDSEWAARVAARFTLLHADIPALHLGLETTDTLLDRFKDSGHNYMRFTSKHPDLAKTLKLHNAVLRLRKTPGQKLMRPVLKGLVKFKLAPTKVRLIALKLWRASWYAEAI